MKQTELAWQIALTLLPGIGSKNAKNLVAYCGGVQAVFEEKKTALSKIPGIGAKTIQSILSNKVMNRVEQELVFIEKHQISSLFYLDKNYPKLLKHCSDGPLLLFQKGNIDFKNRHQVAVVGTRNATTEGKENCKRIIKDLASHEVQIISGLAYGIDICAHKQSIQNQLPTVAVLGHGLDRIYPAIHKPIAEEMIEKGGGLITEFLSGTNPDRENFPKRNRIVAGIAEALIVVEAAKRGGALITAEIANSYNKDVFAVPGRLSDTYSEGCNNLIKINKAALYTGAADLEYLLGWKKKAKIAAQPQMFVDLTAQEQKVCDGLKSNENKMELDQLCFRLNLPVSKVIPTLLSLELKGIVKSNPGKLFELLN